MVAFLTVNVLFILFTILCAFILVLWIYTRKMNTRLSQSIKLINDLYKLNQSQANTLAELSGSPEKSTQGATGFSPSALTQRIAEQAGQLIKEDLVNDITNISNKALINITTRNEDLSSRVLALENQTELLQQEDPELKMYNRAHQLVKEGVSIEDIMEASQLPRAEVEVLVGLQRHKKTSHL
jgi:predicted PurR-regulated permease PerM